MEKWGKFPGAGDTCQQKQRDAQQDDLYKSVDGIVWLCGGVNFLQRGLDFIPGSLGELRKDFKQEQ